MKITGWYEGHGCEAINIDMSGSSLNQIVYKLLKVYGEDICGVDIEVCNQDGTDVSHEVYELVNKKSTRKFAMQIGQLDWESEDPGEDL
tara:strand:- start:773 stop:1039 length:267 start_codon:yes stop_codon:yes gene_type:complete